MSFSIFLNNNLTFVHISNSYWFMFLEGYKKKILDIFRQLKAIKEDKYYESESHSVMSYSF